MSAQSSAPTLVETRRTPRYLPWVNRALLLALLLFAFTAPLDTKATVLAFRLAIALSVLRLVMDRHRRPMPPLAAPLFAFLASCAVASALSFAPILSWGRMRSITVLLLAILLPEFITELRQLKWIVTALLLGCAIAVGWTGWTYAAGIGVKLGSPAGVLRPVLRPGDIVESVDGHRVHTPAEWQRTLSGGSSPQLHLRVLRGVTQVTDKVEIARAAVLRAGLARTGATKRGRPRRAPGLFYSYIPFSEQLMMAGLLLGGLLAAGTFKHRWTKTSAITLFVGLLAGLLATATRAPLALLLCGSFVLCWVRANRKFRPLFAVLLLAATVLVSFWIHHQRGLRWFSEDAGTQYRLLMWRDGLRMIPQHPLFGVGFDSVVGLPGRWHMEAYERFPNLRSHFHSVPIQLAVEGGMVTLAAWTWLMVAYFLLLWRLAARSRVDPFARGLCLGLLAAMAGFTLISLVHYAFGDAEVMMLFWLFLGLGTALERVLSTAQANPHSETCLAN